MNRFQSPFKTIQTQYRICEKGKSGESVWPQQSQPRFMNTDWLTVVLKAARGGRIFKPTHGSENSMRMAIVLEGIKSGAHC